MKAMRRQEWKESYYGHDNISAPVYFQTWSWFKAKVILGHRNLALYSLRMYLKVLGGGTAFLKKGPCEAQANLELHVAEDDPEFLTL